MGQNTKIDWCDSSWNPVTGCLHGCEYCYARGIARRFGGHLQGCIEPGNYELTQPMYDITPMSDELARVGRKLPYPYDFEPTFHRYKLDEPQSWKRPRTIFVCSMADLFGEWVPDEWVKAVFDACEAAPQHRYLFLTKAPWRLKSLADQYSLPANENFWYGTSTPKVDDVAFWGNCYHTFLSIEPILERFGRCGRFGTLKVMDWTIVGAETGNRKDKVMPEKGWIMEIAEECAKYGKPIFMKESLRGIMGDDFRQEFPWEVEPCGK